MNNAWSEKQKAKRGKSKPLNVFVYAKMNAAREMNLKMI